MRMKLSFILLIFVLYPMHVRASEVSPRQLTLDDVLYEGVNQSNDILVYTYKWAMLNAQKEAVRESLNELKEPTLEPLKLLPTTREYFLTLYPNYEQATEEEKQVIDQQIAIQIAINQSLNIIIQQNYQASQEQLKALQKDIQEKKKQLASLIKELESSQNITKIDEQEAKEFIRYQLAKNYISVLSYDEQIAYLQKEIQFLAEDMKRVEAMVEIGEVSKDELRKKQREWKNKKKELEHVQKERVMLEFQLKIDLNVPQAQPVTFQSIPSSFLRKIETPKDVKSLVYRSFLYLKKQENLKLANDKKGQAANQIEKQQMEQYVKMSEAQLNAVAKNVERFLAKRYDEFDRSYAKYEDAYDVYQQMLSEQDYYEKQWKIGLISEHDYKARMLNIDKAKRDYMLEFMSYCLLQIEEKQFHNGYIPLL
ncbi:hypothetical protein JV16_01485 [Anoxybacillus ayderensis]|uniref:Outer membrane efflux protein n=2 Tax=Anoxybacillaceae TaxID=3120669 RepID=A0A0D0HPM7_9BACL|nr:S-layer protein [Anoxybacillus ayderensis]KIP21247.1 hypothetical protein JV16_01485 [Anoxybacillus ayderensis]